MQKLVTGDGNALIELVEEESDLCECSPPANYSHRTFESDKLVAVAATMYERVMSQLFRSAH
jgi:hypothetical protein